MEEEYMFKVLIVGPAAVGKTAMTVRYFDNCFLDGYISSVGIDFKERTIVREGHKIRLQVWDTAGQERYKTLTLNYYRRASGFIIVFDLTRVDSFKNVTNWVQDAREMASDSVAIVLVGSKSDATWARVVSTEEGSKLAQSLGVKYFETSSKEDSNVTEVFDALLEAMMAGKKETVEGKREQNLIKLGGAGEKKTEIQQQNTGRFCIC